MLEDKFQSKLKTLMDSRNLVSNDLLKNKYNRLIDLVYESEGLYTTYVYLIDLKLNNSIKKDSEDTKNQNIVDVDIERLDEPTKGFVKQQLEVLKVLKEKNIGIENNLKNIKYIEDFILNDCKRLIELTFEKILSKDYSSEINQVIFKLLEEIISAMPIYISLFYSFLNLVVELDKAEIKKADDVLQELEFQIITFSLINDMIKINLQNLKV